MKRYRLAIATAALLSVYQSTIWGQLADPPLLTFDEIKQLYQDADPPPPLRDKLRTLLTTPFVRNNASEGRMMPLKPSDPETGKMLRVAQWNIDGASSSMPFVSLSATPRSSTR